MGHQVNIPYQDWARARYVIPRRNLLVDASDWLDLREDTASGFSRT